MSEIEDKILGREKKAKSPAVKHDYFADTVVWQVSKEGCGTCSFNGKMVYEMLSADGKRNAKKGQQKFSDNGFVFQRKK